MSFTRFYQFCSVAGLVLLAGNLDAGFVYSAEPSVATPSIAALIDESYTLGAGDLVQLDIFDAPEYSGQNARYQVLIDGSLNLPLVGSVPVKGLTLNQAGKQITQKYLRFFRRPLTTVTLVTPRPLSITLTGEVNRPGSYPIPLTPATPTATLSFPTLTSALKLAGGITQAADIKNIQIQRISGNNRQTLTANLGKFLQLGDRTQDVTLRDGDSIVIPTATKIDLTESAQLANSTFAADREPITIAVVGEVFRPGAYVVAGNIRTGAAGVPGATNQATIEPFPTVTRAIQSAGGIKPQADIRRIQIRRLARNGTEQTFEINLLKLLKEGDLRQDAILQTGDTIAIPTATQLTPAEAAEIASSSFSPDTIRVNVVGEVKQPGTVQIPPNTSLNQALLAAGGFDQRRAKTRAVDLIRLNPDGTISRRAIAIDLSQGINDRTNPAMQNNDIIVVGRSGMTRIGDGINSVLAPVGNIFSVFNILKLFGL
ncbi:SLBB domain-containing protein [Cyanobacteria bacterium FACHB-DQ100]|nr:SLBB domain-containing protein [Cyanobacteria bacterium FACHB-DQ100]